MSAAPAPSAPDPLDALAEAFLARYRRGERPGLSEYIAAHPELADDIRELFPALVELEGLKSGDGDETRGGGAGVRGRRAIPAQLGDYRILREVGRGGMGVVYEAIQESLGRRVALKVLPPERLSNPTFLKRFLREARSAAALHHSNIVPVFGVGECQGHHYFAMQYIRGQTVEAVLDEVRRLKALEGPPAAATCAEPRPAATGLARRLLTGGFVVAGPDAPAAVSDEALAPTQAGEAPVAPGPSTGLEAPGSPGAEALTPDSLSSQTEARYYRAVARVALQVAEALAYAHDQGILHRDIKPSNLLLDARGVVWTTDFGLAKGEGVEGVTEAGDIVGTLRYMASERFDGRSDRRSDVYSLGVTLYEMATLRPIFEAQDRAALIERVLHDTPVPPRRLDPQIPRDLETIILKAIAKEPGHRFATAGGLADELRLFVAGRPIRSRPITAAERCWRWCRRNPLVASLNALAATLTVAIAVISTISAAQLKQQRDALRREQGVTELALKQARQSEREARESDRERTEELGRSYLTQARAGLISRRAGQRFESLDAIARAVRIARDLGAPPERYDALRDAAIAALTLPDVRDVDTIGQSAHDINTIGIAINARCDRYIVHDRLGDVRVCRVADDAELYHVTRVRVSTAIWVALSPDGGMASVYVADGSLKLWKLEGARPTLLLDLPPGSISFEQWGYSRVWGYSPDGRTFVYVTAGGGLVRVDLTNDRRLTLPSSDGHCVGIAFHPDGRLAVLLVRGATRVVEVRTLDDARALAKITLPEAAALAWNPDGRQLAASGGRTIYLWDTIGGSLQTLKGSNALGIQVGFHPAGLVLASNSWEHRLKLWDARTGRQLFSTPMPESSIQFSPDGCTLAGLVEVGKSRWRHREVADGREYRTAARAPAASVGAGGLAPTGAIHPSGRLMVASAGPTGVQFWDLDRGEEVADLEGVGYIEIAGFNEDGSLLTSGSYGIHRWPVRPGGPGLGWRIGPPEVVLDGNLANCFINRNRDGRVLVVGRLGHGAFVLRQGSRTSVYLRPQRDVRRVAVSPDGRWAATGSWHGDNSGVFIWDAATGERVATIPAPDKASLAFSPDGRWLAIGPELGGEGRLWHVGSWTAGPSLGGGGGVCFSPDGSLLAHTTSTGVRLQDPETGRILATLEAPAQDRSDQVAFAPDGSRLVTHEPDSPVLRVWDLRLIRAQLKDLGLDWDRPPYPSAPPGPEGPAAPLVVRFETPEVIRLPSQGHEAARQGRWAEAAAAFARAIESRADDPWAWQNHALSRLAIGDRAGYRAVCAQMLDRFGQTRDSTTANQVAWLGVLGPDAVAEPGRLVALAERGLAAKPGDYLLLNTLGAALYRAGRLEDAARALEEAVGKHGRGGNAYDHLFLAMVHHRLGHARAAADWLDRAGLWLGAAHVGPVRDPYLGTSLSWSHQLELRVLRQEAEALLGRPARELPADVFARPR